MNNSDKRQGTPGRRVVGSLYAISLFLCGAGNLWAQMKPAVPAQTDSTRYEYEADRVVDDLTAGRVVLEGKVVLRFRGTELRAEWVELDRKAQRLTARAVPDATGAGRDLPVLIRGKERFSGTRLVYDLKTGRGRVTGGRAAYLGKYYRGENILLSPEGALYARNLSVSTCNRDHVHYDFLCGNLKVLEDDKAIGRSVTFRIGPVPVAWLPFFVFPTTTGRKSGLLTPNIGSNSRDGFFVRNLGYYYAPSDYWDATFRTTFRESGGFLVDTNLVYNVRRRISGAANLSLENRAGSRSWRLNVRHQQRLSPTLNVRGSGSFSTASFERRNSDDLYRALNRQLRSSLSLDKRWAESGRSLDASTTFYRDLARQRNSFQGFPRLSFRQGRRPLIGGSGRSATGRSWYRSIFYAVSGELNNSLTRHAASADTLDSEDLSLRGRFSLNSQHRALGWLDVTPSFSTTQHFSRNDQDRDTRRETYRANLSTGTTLYGIFRPQRGRLRGIRHRLQPRIDFRYRQIATVAGGTFGLRGKRSVQDPTRHMSFGLGNAFDIKTEREGRETRFTFASVNFSTGYRFDGAARKWEPLRTVASVKPDRRADVRLSMTHDFYDDQDRLSMLGPRLQRLAVTSSFRLGGGRGAREEAARRAPISAVSSDFGFERDLYEGGGDVTNPWRVNVTHYYDLRKQPAKVTRSWLKADFGFNPTRAWRISYGLNYDIEGRKLTAQNLSVYRDLHCWEARFSWHPTGFNSGFYFKINIKGIPQIKLEHRQGGFGA